MAQATLSIVKIRAEYYRVESIMGAGFHPSSFFEVSTYGFLSGERFF